MKLIILPTFFTITLFVEIFVINGIPILKETFPLDNTEAVLFSLSQNISGSRDFVLSLFFNALRFSLILTFITCIVFHIIIFFKTKYNNVQKTTTHLSYNKLIILANAIAIALFSYTAYTQIPIIDYLLTWKNLDAKSEHSEFYIKEYVNPDSVQIQFKEKKNLILIFLESMEYNFQDSANGGNLQKNLIPEITDYINNEQSFIPGGTQAWGMGWTMADAIAKTCGIPATFPPSISNHFKPLKKFLPGVTCLTDILSSNDYNVIVSKGANLSFSGMNDFLNTHSVSKAFGFLEYAKDERVKKDTTSFWGVKDQLHYELVKEHINYLAKLEKPWALWFFTVDTHTPFGYLDPSCIPQEPVPKERQYPHVVKCSSRQLKEFIEWAKKQGWYNKTTIAVMGDHAAMAEPEIIGFKDHNLTHYWLDFFINSSMSAEQYKRAFTSLDFFPTILESIGAEIPGRALGLGRSLYANKPTLLEKYGLDSLNNALKKKSIEYDYFFYFDKR